MNFSLAFIKNDQQFMLHDFTDNPTETKAKHINLEDLSSHIVQAIFIPKEISHSEEITNALEQEMNKVAIFPIDEQTLSAEDFDTLKMEQALPLFQKTYSPWVLKNNLTLLETIVPTSNHLKSLWPNDRTAFFEELWHVLRKVLGARTLKLAYNHMQKAQKDHEKNKLIRVIVEGDKNPQPIENKELGEALFKNYEGKFNDHFEVHEISDDNQVVCLANVNNSPIIIMAETYGITPIQKSLLTALFDILQS
jgi:hypothetical protein